MKKLRLVRGVPRTRVQRARGANWDSAIFIEFNLFLFHLLFGKRARHT